MKMNFLPKNSYTKSHSAHFNFRRKSLVRSSIYWVLGIFFLLALIIYFFPKTVRTSSYTVARPIWIIQEETVSTISKIRDFFTFKSWLTRENQALRDEVTALSLQANDYDTILKENDDLKILMGRQQALGSSTEDVNGHILRRVLSRIISKPPRSPYDTLVIDTGSSEGITVGSKVFISSTLVVGLVTDVTPHSSLVTLFSASGQKTVAENFRTAATFEISGQGGATMTITVPKETDILWGDKFVYSALTPATLGLVYYVDNTSQSSFKTIYIRTQTNVFAIKWVFVEKKL